MAGNNFTNYGATNNNSSVATVGMGNPVNQNAVANMAKPNNFGVMNNYSNPTMNSAEQMVKSNPNAVFSTGKDSNGNVVNYNAGGDVIPNMNQSNTTYKIQNGDTLSGIASRNGMSINDLMSLNPNITNPNKIFAGQSINLRGGNSASNNAGNTTTQTNPQAQTQTNTSTTPIYQNLMNNSQAQSTTPQPYQNNNQLYGNITNNLANLSNTIQTDPIYQGLIQKISDLRSGTAQQVGNLSNSGMESRVALGMAGNLQNTEAQQEQALTGQASNRLNQLSTSAGVLENAGGLARPQTGVAYGTQIFNPNTGTLSSAGSPFTAGQYDAERQAGQNYALNNSTYLQSKDSINAIGNLLNNGTINPNDLTAGNKVAAWLSGQTSDPQYQQLASYISDYLGKIAPIVGQSSATDYKSQLVNSMVNGNMNPAAIVKQVNGLDALVHNIVNTQSGGTQTLPSGSNSSGGMFGSFFK